MSNTNATGLSRLRPEQWRTLNHIRNLGHGTPRGIQISQTVDAGELLELEMLGLVAASVKGEAVQLCDMTALGATYVALRLTIRGDHFVDCPPNRVVRALADQRHGLLVGKIREVAEVDDDLLRQMDEEQLLRVDRPEGLSLAAFRKFPQTLVLRLSRRGEQYAAG